MNWKIVIILVLSNLLYASELIFSKYASLANSLNFQYVIGVVGVFIIMGLYAILWQQILKRVDLSIAYMFKGTSLVFTMCFSFFLFGENVTIYNIVGTLLLISGICLYAKG